MRSLGLKGKITRGIKKEFSKIHWLPSILGSGIFMLAGCLVRFVSGSPYQHGIMLKFDGDIPPVWLMTFLWMFWYAVLGASLLTVLCKNYGRYTQEIEKYRGSILFLCMLFLGFLWYPLFFVAARLFLSALLILLIIFFCILSGWIYWRGNVCRGVSVILFCHAVFLMVLFFINLKIAFHG